jgi:hypothetical protein
MGVESHLGRVIADLRTRLGDATTRVAMGLVWHSFLTIPFEILKKVEAQENSLPESKPSFLGSYED